MTKPKIEGNAWLVDAAREAWQQAEVTGNGPMCQVVIYASQTDQTGIHTGASMFGARSFEPFKALGTRLRKAGVPPGDLARHVLKHVIAQPDVVVEGGQRWVRDLDLRVTSGALVMSWIMGTPAFKKAQLRAADRSEPAMYFLVLRLPGEPTRPGRLEAFSLRIDEWVCPNSLEMLALVLEANAESCRRWMRRAERGQVRQAQRSAARG